MSPNQSKLTVDMVREALDYDPETGLFRWKKPTGGRARVGDIPRANCHGYIAISVHGERHYAHRLAWFHHYGKWPEQVIDHIDGSKDNNRIANLRDVSSRMNAQNKRDPVGETKTNCLGVTYDPKRKKYRASLILEDGRRQSFGRYDTFEHAQAMYIAGKRIFHAGNTL